MGALPKQRKPHPQQVYFLFREDIRHMQNIARETWLLVKHGIDTAEQLAWHKGELTAQINETFSARKQLRNQARGIKDEDKLSAAKSEISLLSKRLAELRREVRLCEDIERRSAEMQDKLKRARVDEKSQGKEKPKHEPFRGRR